MPVTDTLLSARFLCDGIHVEQRSPASSLCTLASLGSFEFGGAVASAMLSFVCEERNSQRIAACAGTHIVSSRNSLQRLRYCLITGYSFARKRKMRGGEMIFPVAGNIGHRFGRFKKSARFVRT